MRKLLLVLLLLMPAPVWASTSEELEQAESDLEASRARQEELDRKSGKLATSLSALQKRLVDLTAKVQAGEEELSLSEDKLRILARQIKLREKELAAGRHRLGELVKAALKLSRLPPEAMVVMPGDMGQNIKAARALRMAADNIRKEVESVQAQVRELESLEQKVLDRRGEIAAAQQKLAEERKTLQAQLEERRRLHRRLGSEQKEEAEKIAQLARKAEDLKKLMDELQRQARPRPRRGDIAASQPPAAAQKGQMRPFESAKGYLRMPAAGRVVQAFGSASGRDSTSKGITVSTRENAPVVSPFDGEVVFTGPFLNYGKLVIVRHSDEFHTLLAGLSKINVSPGEFLLEGEPIGAMGKGAGKNRLYVELRKSNQPIDPAGWIKGMK